MKGERYPLHQSPFYKLRSKKRLAEIIGVNISVLQDLARKVPDLYREFEVEKKGGGARKVESPLRSLKRVQARIARLLSRIEPPDYLYCPVKGRCYVSNAARHREGRVIRTLDVKKYFPSTSRRRVFWFFSAVMRCERDVAGLLANLATFNGHLPTGSPLSPIMAYFSYYDVWEAVAKIANEAGCTLTVYVDDVTISGASVPEAVMWRIKKAIHGSGLRYHKVKKFVDRPAEVTGVIVGPGSLKVPNRQRKKLFDARRIAHQASLSGAANQATSAVAGLEGQLRQVEGYAS